MGDEFFHSLCVFVASQHTHTPAEESVKSQCVFGNAETTHQIQQLCEAALQVESDFIGLLHKRTTH